MLRSGPPIMLVWTLLLFSEAGWSQCSDAGVCSIGGMEPPAHLLTVSGAVSYGRSSDDDLSFKTAHLGARARISEHIQLSASLPYRSITGPLGSVSGPGDLLIVGRFLLWDLPDMSVNLEGGVRFPTGGVNEGGLPQAYQPGLGTTDGLIGISLTGTSWSASAGYQYAPGRSANTVNRLRRGDDISVRGSFVLLDDGYTVQAEAIVIHKLRESDGYYLRTATSSYLYAPGGTGIPRTDRTQINLVGDLAYPLEHGISLNLRAAVALLSRPVNVDGLKRNFTLQAGIAVPVL